MSSTQTNAALLARQHHDAEAFNAFEARLQAAVDTLAQVEQYLMERVSGKPASTGATKILPMIRKAIEGAGVAPTQTSWGDC